MKTAWESQLDTSVLEQSREKILQVLNMGSFKDLKGLQQIGDKKAKLILGWRELNGQFSKVGETKSPSTTACLQHRSTSHAPLCCFTVGRSGKS